MGWSQFLGDTLVSGPWDHGVISTGSKGTQKTPPETDRSSLAHHCNNCAHDDPSAVREIRRTRSPQGAEGDQEKGGEIPS